MIVKITKKKLSRLLEIAGACIEIKGNEIDGVELIKNLMERGVDENSIIGFLRSLGLDDDTIATNMHAAKGAVKKSVEIVLSEDEEGIIERLKRGG